MKRRRWVLLVCLVSDFIATPQQSIDSLERRLSSSLGQEKVDLLNELSYQYSMNVEYEKCYNYAKQALALANEINYEKGKGDALNRFGNYYHSVSEFDKALDYFLQALQIREKINDSIGISSSYSNVALIYYAFNDLDKTIEYTERALQITEEINDKQAEATACNNLSVFWMEKGNFEKSKQYALRALDLYKAVGLKRGMGDAMNNLGDLYVELKDYSSAIIYHMRSLAIYEEVNDPSRIANSKMNIGQLYYKRGRLAEARKWLTDALQASKGIPSKETIKNIYEWNSIYYEHTGDYKKAIDFYLLYSQMKDTIFSTDASEQIAELQVRFETGHKDKEIQLLNQEKAILELKIKKQRYLTIFLSSITGLLIITMIIGGYVFRMKKSINSVLKEKNNELFNINRKLAESKTKLESLTRSKERYFSILAIDLINPFRALMQLAENIHDNHESMSDHELLDNSRELYLNTHNLFYLLENLLYWSRIQSGNVEPHLKNFAIYPTMNDLINTLRIHAEDKNIHLMYHIPADLTVFADQQLFGVIFRNLLYNAIKYSAANGKILVEATYINNEVEIRVEDKGIGIRPEHLNKLFQMNNGYTLTGTSGEHGSGLGLILSKELIEKNGGTLHVESEHGKGSSFSFTLPLKK
jgi:two-component system sensor histidine kinase/response regulator